MSFLSYIHFRRRNSRTAQASAIVTLHSLTLNPSRARCLLLLGSYVSLTYLNQHYSKSTQLSKKDRSITLAKLTDNVID